jgi:hypothetical protein
MSELAFTPNRAERRAMAKAAKKPPRVVKRPDPFAYRTAIAGAHKLTADDQLTRAARVRCSIEELGKDAANVDAWRDVFDVVNLLEAFAQIGCIRHAKEFLSEQQENVVAALDRQRETGSNVLRPVELQLLRDLAATWAEVLAEVTCNQYLQAEERVKRKVSNALKAGSRGAVRLITPPAGFRESA